MNDGTVDSADAIVSIIVNAVNDAPVATDQEVTGTEDTPISITLTGTDADAGDTLTYTVVTNPSNGTLSGTAPNLTYTPSANYNGADSFTFKVNDGTEDSATATVSITISAVNDAPVATDQEVTATEDTPISITLTGTDADSGTTLSYAVVTNPSHGTLSGTAPNLTYTPSANYNGADSFTFKVNDGTVDSADAIVSITVNAVNDVPTISGTPDDAGVSTLYSWTPTASDAEGDDLTYSISEGSLPDGLTLDADTGEISGTPTTGGTFSFTIQVSDGQEGTATLATSIKVNPKISVIAAESMDRNGNGYLDTMKITFSGNVDKSTFPGYNSGSVGTSQTVWLVAGYSNVKIDDSVSGAGADEIYLNFDEGLEPDTGAKPDVTTSEDPELKDTLGFTVEKVETLTVTESDKASPVIVSAAAKEESKRLTLTFSEAVYGTTGGIVCTSGGQLTKEKFSYNGGSTGASTIVGMETDCAVNAPYLVRLTMNNPFVKAEDDGNDTITPALDAVYDTASNKASNTRFVYVTVTESATVPVSDNIQLELPETVYIEGTTIPDTDYEGVFIKIDDETKGFIAEITDGAMADCTTVSCLMDTVLGAVADDDYSGYLASFDPDAVKILNAQTSTEGSGYSLVSRRVIEAATVPSEIATVQIIVNTTAELKEGFPNPRVGGTNGFTADEMRSHYVNLLGHVTGEAGTIENLPTTGTSVNETRKFRLEIQATKEAGASKPALLMVALTAVDHFPEVEEILVNLVNGTNIAPSTYTKNDGVESFSFEGQSKVDFVYAVDNSGSMAEEITGVVMHASKFFDRLAKLGVDFQIAVIASDRPTIAGPQTAATINYDRNNDGSVTSADDCSTSVYRKGFSNTKTDFMDSICVGKSGSGQESNILEATRSLRYDPNNVALTDNQSTVAEGRRLKGRSDVNLSFIMVTDEGDQFYKYRSSNPPYNPNNDDYFSGTFTPFNVTENDFFNRNTGDIFYKVYGVIGLTESGTAGTCSGNDGLNAVVATNANNTYITGASWNYMVADGEPVYQGIYDLAKDTKGAVSSICSANYGAFLEQVADQEAARASKMKLPHTPITSTIMVLLNGAEVPSGYAESGQPTRYLYNSVENTISFTGTQPTAGTTVTVNYKYYTAP